MTPLSGIWTRLLFAVKYKTFRRMVACEGQLSQLAVYHKGNEVRINRRCPHQGGPLEKGRIEGNDLVCPWHGCRFSLTASRMIRPYVPVPILKQSCDTSPVEFVHKKAS